MESVTLSTKVSSIEEEVFSGCSKLSTIAPLGAIKTIGSRAFMNCTSLGNITIPAGMTDVGNGAFAGCNNLKLSVSASNPNYSAKGNILYNKTGTKLIASGKIDSQISIDNTINEISPYAFAYNSNLISVRFSGTPKIGEYAFYNCANMNSVYFDSYDVPTVGENSFSNDNFSLYTRYNSQAAYENLFKRYTSKIKSLEIKVNFISNGEIIKSIVVYNGSTVKDLPIPTKVGNTFSGWYKNASYSGTPYQNGDLWESETDIQVYAKWTPKYYTITLNPNGGILQGNSKINGVLYYESADDVLIEGLSQNQDFFTLLLNNDDIKKEMLGIFLGEIYKEFRND